MKNNHLWALWAVLFVVTGALGFAREAAAGYGWLLTLAAVGFFVPPGVLIWRARRSGDRRSLSLIRWLSVGSLGATAVLLAANFLSVLGSQALGNFLHWVLTIVSAPMICGGSWVLSLFLWACLLFASISKKSGRKVQ